MRYFGGKFRVAKPLSKFINSRLKSGQVFVDAFCGSCNVITNIDSDRRRIANDLNPYVIEMWKAVQNGWVPPKQLQEDEYNYIKSNKEENMALTSFAGFGCSFSGKFFGGYARNGAGGSQKYCENAYNGVLKKAKLLNDVQFYSKSYYDLLESIDIPDSSLIYCDIPYKNTTGYSTGKFDHEQFYEWAKFWAKKHTIFISEYKENVPSDAKIIWEHSSKKDILDKDKVKQLTTEVIFTYNDA